MNRNTRAEVLAFYRTLGRNDKGVISKLMGFSQPSGLVSHLRRKGHENDYLTRDKQEKFNQFLKENGMTIQQFGTHELINIKQLQSAISSCDDTLKLDVLEDKLDLLLMFIKARRDEIALNDKLSKYDS